MKNRDSLIRLHRFQVDEKRRQVGELEMMIEEFQRKERDLDAQVQAEQERAGISDEAHFAYPMFAKAVNERRNNILHSISEIERQLEGVREELGDAYRDLKKIETLENGRRRREHKKAVGVEQREMDDVALGVHRRSSEIEAGS